MDDERQNKMENIEKVAEELKAAQSAGQDSVELALLARERLGAGFGAIAFIACFRLAFHIPVTVLQRAQAWHRFGWGAGNISDEEFSTLLSPWLAAPDHS
ncbi:hypothetical protein AB0D59_05765 [Streptomyces sp. NPDC048417]|uniref:hypothetical protein n=1 Tax=Streptomyces sp. NPDC048417 TaxID=3155387 RepID=UPI0034226983